MLDPLLNILEGPSGPVIEQFKKAGIKYESPDDINKILSSLVSFLYDARPKPAATAASTTELSKRQEGAVYQHWDGWSWLECVSASQSLLPSR
jgi:hypothetical protein